MEKQAGLINTADHEAWEQSRQEQKPPRSRRSRWAFVFAALLLVTWSLRPRHGTWFPLRDAKPTLKASVEPFSWDNLPSRSYLDYHDCFDELDDHDEGGFKCARLELPMDYWNGTTNATMSIAVVKKPAKVPVTHPQYGGAILLNPGGPGGSGVYFTLGVAHFFGDIINDEKALYFDFIGFDPRGVGESRPLIRCLDNPRLEQSWAVRTFEEGVFGSSDAAFGRLWSMAAARLKSCSLPRSDGEADIKKYASTASVARDMVEIIERHGQWREEEARRLLNERRGCSGRQDDGVSQTVPKTLKHQKNEERLNYWGFSYGSYLGNTFAAMFPERVNRLIVDGVVDAYDYKKAIWMDNLVDTEKDMDQLYYHCARVGFPTCALANSTGATTEEGVKARTLNILQSLYHNPLPIIDASQPEVITYSDLKYLVLGTLYGPLYGFPYLAAILADIERGDGGELADLVRAYHSFSCPSDSSATSRSAFQGPPAGGLAILTQDATIGIACADGDDQSGLTRDDFREHLANLTKLSPSIGEVWSLLRMQCIHYGIRPVHRFEGPWVGNTSHPLLEIGNVADPVTPGRFAKKMAKGFPGAVALIQNSAGHCSLAAPSKCTMGYVKNYFQTGELPPEDTLCEADAIPFGPTPGEDVALDVETSQLMKSQARIAKALYAAGGGFSNPLRYEGIRDALFS